MSILEEAGAEMGRVRTVLGEVASEDLGATLMHEHIFVDLTCNWQGPGTAAGREVAEQPVTIEKLGLLRRNPTVSRDNCLLTDSETAIKEVEIYRRLGGGTIVDVTLSDIGRDPVALQVVSRATGIHIVAGCGHYIKEAHPPSLAIESVEAVADRLVAEIVEGIDLTGVKAGIIGEIGVSDPVHKDEEKVLRAAAIAQRSTGVPISLHVLTGNGHHVLDILEDAGAALARVIVGHQDLLLGYPGAREEEVAHYHLSLAERGVYIQFDCFGKDHYFPRLKGYSEAFWAPSDRERCRALKRLLDAGLGDKLLLSHDICHKIELVAYGGFGYGHLLRTVPQNCADAGIPPEDLLRLITDNPAQVLSIALPELVEAKT